MATGTSVKIVINQATIKKLGDVAEDRMHEAVIELHKTTLETLSGNRSGRTYLVPGTKRTYTASSPGQPPAQVTGGLRQSIKWEVNSIAGKLIGKVGTNLDYGVMLEYGTHGGAVIKPKKAKVLAFWVGGKMVFAKQVIQGAIAPRPWLRISAEKAKDNIAHIFSRGWL